MSFFDEDDEPLRTTTRRQPRSQPRPRRGSPAGGGGGRGGTDQQTLLVRRMLGVLGVVLVLLVLGLLVKSCNSSRHKTALSDYNRQVNNIGAASAQTGSEYFRAMGQASNQSPEDLQGAISSFKVNADQQLKQAEDLNVPGEMAPAQQSFLIALQLRRNALGAVAADIRTALGDQGDAADKAIERIAGQNNALNASDVLDLQRVVPFIKDALTKGEVSGQTVQASQVVSEISWISKDYVAQKLGQQLTAGNEQRNQPTGPGLHGTGLNGTSYGNTTLAPGTTNRLTYVAGQGFTVSFTNQGDNDEFNVKVTLKIARDAGSPITLTKTVQKVAKGEKATVTLPLNREPPIDTAVTISVTVAAVPGETKTDNNKSSYPTLFSRG